MTISKPVFDRLGFSLWIGAFLVVLALVLWSPDTRTVLLAYRDGSEKLLAGQPLYNLQSEMGYLYAPPLPRSMFRCSSWARIWAAWCGMSSASRC